jgi:hypothetical protein
MNEANGPMNRIKAAVGLALLVTVAGCVGYEGGGYVEGGYGGAVVAPVPVPPPPDVFLFGGDFDRGHDVHEYRRRGYESREHERHEYERHEHWH